MGVWYEFYLDKQIGEDEWSSVLVNNSKIIYEVRGGFTHYFCDEYGYDEIWFNNLSKEFQQENKEKYEEYSEHNREWAFTFHYLELERMHEEYINEVHEYAGIISKNSYKRLQTNPDYNAKIIEESDYARFKDNIKEHYLYYEWNSTQSEFYYLYEIMPIVEKALKDNNLNINEVRLIYREI